MLRLTTFLLMATFASSAVADCVIAWPSGAFTNDTWGAGHLNSNPTFAFAREVSDDFDFAGNITRVYVAVYNGGPFGSATPIDGVWVRFYAWTASGPGALQAAYFVAGNDPNVGVEPRPSGVEVGLATPFVATGKHFVSVQVDFSDYGWWEPWQTNVNAPRLSTGWVRTNGAAWGLYTPQSQTQPLMADVDIVLYTDPAPVCAQWTKVALPTPGTDADLVDVEVIATNDIWALGNMNTNVAATLSSLPFALHNDGNTWSIVNLPPAVTLGSLGSRTSMHALEAINASDLWAAGSHNIVVPGGWVGHQIRADHYDGATWTTMNTPLPPTSGSAGYSGSRIAAIKAFATNDVWFVGEWSGPYPGLNGLQPALAMRWDGSTFTLIATPEVLPIGGNGLEAIDGVAPNDIWAVGGAGDGDLSSYSYILHWNGSSWSHVPGPLVGLMQRLTDVEAISANDVWAVGEAYTTSGLVAILQHWNGTSWSNVAGPAASFSAEIHANSATDVWLGQWHWNGSSWNLERVADCDPWASAGSIGGGSGRLFMVGSASLPGSVPYMIERTPNCTSGSYCTSSTTTNGCVPTMSSTGTASASAATGFTLHAGQVEGQRSGVIFYGASGPMAVAWASGSTSTLCVKAPAQRMGVHNSGGMLGACDGALAQDWNAFMAANPSALGNPRSVGASFDAQAWFRDPLAAKSTNLSNAFHFNLAP